MGTSNRTRRREKQKRKALKFSCLQPSFLFSNAPIFPLTKVAREENESKNIQDTDAEESGDEIESETEREVKAAITEIDHNKQ